jgi:23S rRNA pseudouridine1911/1915/1917 synthase
MSHIGFPLVGDPTYGRRLALAGDCHPDLEQALRGFRRQALHATRIEYAHPTTGEQQSWERAVPVDMSDLFAACENDADEGMNG